MNQYWDSCGQYLLGNNCSCTSKNIWSRFTSKPPCFEKTPICCSDACSTREPKNTFTITALDLRTDNDPTCHRQVCKNDGPANTGNLFVLQRSHWVIAQKKNNVQVHHSQCDWFKRKVWIQMNGLSRVMKFTWLWHRYCFLRAPGWLSGSLFASFQLWFQ